MSPPKKPEPSSEEVFVSKLVSSIVQWFPLGGSGGLLISFLLKEEWLHSVFLFPLTAIAGVWASYSKNFVDQLTLIYAERGKQDANAFVAWLDSLDKALKWQFSGFEKQYLQAQSDRVSEYLTEGFNPDRTAIPLLEEVYVPLELSGYGVFNGIDKLEQTENLNNLSIWDILLRSQDEKQYRQIVIQARGGFGKTTLLRHIAWMFGRGKHKKFRVKKRIPFLLHLRDWHEALTRSEMPTLEKLLRDHVERLKIKSLKKEHSLGIPPIGFLNA